MGTRRIEKTDNAQYGRMWSALHEDGHSSKWWAQMRGKYSTFEMQIWQGLHSRNEVARAAYRCCHRYAVRVRIAATASFRKDWYIECRRCLQSAGWWTLPKKSECVDRYLPSLRDRMSSSYFYNVVDNGRSGRHSESFHAQKLYEYKTYRATRGAFSIPLAKKLKYFASHYFQVLGRCKSYPSFGRICRQWHSAGENLQHNGSKYRHGTNLSKLAMRRWSLVTIRYVTAADVTQSSH